MVKNSFGFTLVELMISVSLLMVFTVGGVIYINNFITKQKLEKVNAEIESMVQLTANYARIKQKPSGYSSEVRYVSLVNNSGKIEASVNGSGTTYFSNKISEVGVTASFVPSTIYFWGGTGQLSSDALGSFLGSTETVVISISINQSVAETRTIIINSLGGIN